MRRWGRTRPQHDAPTTKAGASHAMPCIALVFAALGWWLDNEGLREFTILDTAEGGLFVKGTRPRLNYRATATEVVTTHFDAARLTRLINEYRAARH
jgi:hypothetical protein